MHHMDLKSFQMQNPKKRKNNDYLTSTTQMHTTPLYKIQHLDN